MLKEYIWIKMGKLRLYQYRRENEMTPCIECFHHIFNDNICLLPGLSEQDYSEILCAAQYKHHKRKVKEVYWVSAGTLKKTKRVCNCPRIPFISEQCSLLMPLLLFCVPPLPDRALQQRNGSPCQWESVQCTISRISQRARDVGLRASKALYFKHMPDLPRRLKVSQGLEK